MEIEDTTSWRRAHVRSFRQHYAAVPHFGDFWEPLERIYDERWRRLVDLNVAVIDWMLRAFGLSSTVVRASSLSVAGQRSDLLAAICASVGARAYLSGVSGRTYLDERPFTNAGIDVRYHEFAHPTYTQRYEPFVPQLSAVDLLFNVGSDALRVIERANPHAPTSTSHHVQVRH